MYTTVERHQFGVDKRTDINTAILEILNNENNEPATVIHADGSTYLVEHDLGKKYNLDTARLLYQTRYLSNFEQFMNGASPKHLWGPRAFLLDTATGLWLKAINDVYDEPHEQREVARMLDKIDNPAPDVIRSYYRPFPIDSYILNADINNIWEGDEDYDFSIIQHRFNAVFQTAKNRWQYKKAPTR